jgi:hypothetical protein
VRTVAQPVPETAAAGPSTTEVAGLHVQGPVTGPAAAAAAVAAVAACLILGSVRTASAAWAA